ncbi:SLATT domain-containing protein [Bacillus sp. FSL W7-1321]
MSQDTIKQQINRLKKKAEQNRQMHFSISKTANLWNKALHVFALIGSSIIAILTFAEFSTFIPLFPRLTDGTYKLTIGLFAGLIFIITILEDYLGLEKRAVLHETTGKQLTTFIRTASVLSTKENLAKSDLDKVLDEYNSINENAPIIPDRIFLREKQRLYIKIDISKKLEHTSYIPVRVYLLKMKIKSFFLIEETQSRDKENKK